MQGDILSFKPNDSVIMAVILLNGRIKNNFKNE